MTTTEAVLTGVEVNATAGSLDSGTEEPPLATAGLHIANPEKPGDPLAVRLFRFLEARPNADVLLVFSALDRTAPAREERECLALRGLFACADWLSYGPSRRQYDAWRSDQEQPREWPSATFIRETFNNSWRAALAAAGLAPAPDVRAAALLSRGAAIPPEVRQLALSMFAAKVPAGKRTRRAYDEFAREAMGDPRCPAIPLVASSFDRGGLTFTEALVVAGFPDERALRPATRGAGRRAEYEPERMLHWLREAAKHFGFVPGRTRFNQFALERSGDGMYVPRHQAIVREFSSWPRALVKAGVISSEEMTADRFRRGVVGASSEHVHACLAAALRDFGKVPSRGEFKRWRRAALAHPECRVTMIPADLRTRGGHAGAFEAAIAAGTKPHPEIPVIDIEVER